eukprot:comp15346_c0_seq1/m.12221 comp15346_c0_seq1/g.12221  ORF comp15346_c0_seq1/g.12221 comp15346_c0_seq1/m.12221 type:complete len:254 (-) comp15346_c0_seq1:433-1194(-)
MDTEGGEGNREIKEEEREGEGMEVDGGRETHERMLIDREEDNPEMGKWDKGGEEITVEEKEMEERKGDRRNEERDNEDTDRGDEKESGGGVREGAGDGDGGESDTDTDVASGKDGELEGNGIRKRKMRKQRAITDEDLKRAVKGTFELKGKLPRVKRGDVWGGVEVSSVVEGENFETEKERSSFASNVAAQCIDAFELANMKSHLHIHAAPKPTTPKTKQCTRRQRAARVLGYTILQSGSYTSAIPALETLLD